MALESSRREIQDYFIPHPNQRFEKEVMDAQSPKSPTRDSFGTPLWESREKVPFGCTSRRELQRILYGGRWCLPLSPGRGESSESKVARGQSQYQKGAERVLTNLWLVLDAGPCNKIIVPLPSLIPGFLARPSYPFQCWKLGAAPSSNSFRIFTQLDPRVGLSRNLGARHPKWGLGSPPRLPKLQSLIVGVKTPCIEEFFISLENYQSVDVENGLA